MLVVGINGSARKDGNTAIMIKEAFKALEAQGIETELIQLAGKKMHGCIACGKCGENKDRRCAVTNDFVNDCIEAMDRADGVLLGSPTYFANVSTEMKALIDRAGMVALRNDAMFARKVGAAVVAQRRGGAVFAFDAINHFFFINQMTVPGSCYWNQGMGREKGEVSGDEEGMRTMRVLGENMAWLLKKIHG